MADLVRVQVHDAEARGGPVRRLLPRNGLQEVTADRPARPRVSGQGSLPSPSRACSVESNGKSQEL